MYNSPLLTKSQTNRLQQHKYNSLSSSFLDAYMQTWWNFVVSLMPMWLAPNLITIIGLAINIFTSVIFLLYCPTATEEVPRWVPFLCALGLFIYQTLDAIDGKQARRTNNSNALGELFDHGCDSLSTVFVTLAGACAMGMGHLPYWMLYQCLSGTFLFYIAHWQTYVTGQMKFGKFDVTEAQICMMVVLMATALFGSSFWSYMFLGFLPLRWLPLIFATLAALFSLPSTINHILFNGAGKNGSSVAGTSVLQPSMPIFLVVASCIYAAVYSEVSIYERNPILFNMTFGLIGAKITNKLIVAQMTKSELDNLDSTFFVPLAFALNRWFVGVFSETLILWTGLIFAVFDLIWYCSNVCLEICNATGWYLFKINNPPSSSNSRKSSLNRKQQ